MPQSPSLGFELLTSNQDSKHVTVNASALILEAVSIGVVVSQTNTPAVSPTNGQLYIVGTAGTGAFVGQNNKLALYDSTTWYFYSPKTNQTLYNTALASYVRFNGSAWTTASLGGSSYVSPTTTKGDLIVRDATTDVRQPIGTDGHILTADSTVANGLKWAAPAASYVSPTTTKGDLIVRDATTDVRQPVGANGQILTADDAEATGVKWVTPSAGTTSPTTTAGDLIVRNATADQRLPVGTDGQFLVVDTSLAAKVKWAAPPVATSGNYMRLDLDGVAVSTFGTTATDALFGAAATITGSPGLSFTTSTGQLTVPSGSALRLRLTGVIYVQATAAGTRFQFFIISTTATTPATNAINYSQVGGGVVTAISTPTPIVINGFLDLPVYTNPANFSLQVRASAVGGTLSATSSGAAFPIVSRLNVWRV